MTVISLGLQLSPEMEKQIQRNTDRLDKKLEADRCFFRKHPDRRYRVRRSFFEEREAIALTHGPVQTEHGEALFTAVYQVRPGQRVRVYKVGRADAETNMSDAEAEAFFKMTTAGPRMTAHVAKVISSMLAVPR